MNLNAAALRLMAEKGLSLNDVADIVAANEKGADNTNAARQARFRTNRKAARNAVTVTPVTPLNERNNLIPVEVSEDKSSSPQPWSRPKDVSDQIWKDLLTNRKRKNQPNTVTAWKRFRDDLARISLNTGIPPPKLIEHAAAKGWGGIYDPSDQGSQNGPRTGTSKIRGTLDQLFPADQREGSEVGIAGLPDPGRTAQPWH